LGFGALAGRVWQTTVRDHDRYAALARGQQRRLRPEQPWRGDIYAVEDGKPVVIASSIERGSLLVESRPLREPGTKLDPRAKPTRDPELFLERLGRAVELEDDEAAQPPERLSAGPAVVFRRRKLHDHEVA